MSSAIPPAPSATDMSCLIALPVELVSEMSCIHVLLLTQGGFYTRIINVGYKLFHDALDLS